MAKNNGSGTSKREIPVVLQNRINTLRSASNYGKFGFSADDDEEDQVRKRIKAFREGNTNYFEQKKQREEERQRQEEQRKQELEQRRQQNMERMQAYREANHQRRDRERAAEQATTAQRPKATQTSITEETGAAPTRAARPAQQERAAITRATTPQTTRQTSTTNGGDLAWLDDQRRRRQQTQQANQVGTATPRFGTTDYRTSKSNVTDYSSQIATIDNTLSYLKRQEDLLKAVKKGDLTKSQELQAYRQEAQPILGEIALSDNANDVRNYMDQLARQKQELQTYSSANVLRNNQDAKTLYEKTGNAIQDLTDLNYMLSQARNGGRTDEERYAALKDKYGISDSALADYARAVGSGADEEDYEYLTGLSGEYRKLLDLRDNLQSQIDSGQQELQDYGVDYQGIEDYLIRTQKEQEVTEQAEANREYMKQGPGQFLLGSALSVGGNILSSTEALNMFLRNRDNNDPTSDTYRPYSVGDMPITSWTQGLRQGGGEASGENFAQLFANNKGTAAETPNETARWWGNFLYGTGMSIADSATVMAASAATFGAAGMGMGAAEAATLAIMGGTAASNTAMDAIERGASNDQITKLSLAAGVFEAAFEKFSVERILSPKYVGGLSGFFRETFKQMVTEGSEEMATEIANICADTAIMASQSNFEQARSDYRYIYMQQDGMPYDEADKLAKKAAIVDMMKQVGVAGLGGAISGAVMGAGHNAQTQQMDYASDILENARNGVLPSAEEQELIRHNMIDGESLLEDAQQAVREYREANAERIADANRIAQERAGGIQPGAQDTQQQGENTQGSQEGQNGQREQQRRNILQRIQAIRNQRQNNTIGARDMRTNPAEGSARGYSLNTATFQELNRMARAAGVNINIVDSIPGNSDIEGFYHNGQMYITEDSLRSGRAIRTTAAHEITHSLKDGAPEAYARLRQAVIDEAGGEEQLLKPIHQAAQNNGLQMDNETAMDEAIAIRLEQLADTPQLMEELAYNDYNVAQKLYVNFRNFAVDMANKIRGKEASQLQNVVYAWGDALEEARNNTRRNKRGTPQDETLGRRTSPTLQGDNGLAAGPVEEAADQQEIIQGETQNQSTTESQQVATESQQVATESQQVATESQQTDNQETTEDNGEATREEESQSNDRGDTLFGDDGLAAGPVEETSETQETDNAQEGAREEQRTEETAQQETETEEQRREARRRAASENRTHGRFAQAMARQAEEQRLTWERENGIERPQEATLISEDGLEAGTELTDEERQLQQRFADLEENNPTLATMRRNIARGVATQEDYNAVREFVLRDDPEYQRLLDRQSDLDQQRANRGKLRRMFRGVLDQFDRAATTPEQAQLQADEEQLQQDIQDFVNNDVTLSNIRQLYLEGVLPYESYRQMVESVQRNSDTGRELWERSEEINQRRLDMGLDALEEEDVLDDALQEDAAADQTEETLEETAQEEQMPEAADVIQGAETAEEQTEGAATAADQQQTTQTAEDIQARMDELEQNNDILAMMRDSLENGDIDQEAYDDARDRMMQQDPEYRQLRQQLQELRRQQNQQDGTRFRRRSVSEEAAKSYEEIDALREVNRALKEQLRRRGKQLEYWKGQWVAQDLNMADQKEIRKAVEQVMDAYESEADIDNIVSQITDAYKLMAKAKTAEEALNNEEVTNILRAAAYDMVSNAWHNVYDDTYNTKQILEFFRTTPMYVSHDLDGEIISYYGSLEEFQRRTFGKIKITRTDANADSPDAMIAQVERYITGTLRHGDNEADCLFAMVDFVDQLRAGKWENPHAGQLEGTADYLAEELKEKFFDLPKVKPTKADKNLQKLQEQRERDNQRMKDALHQMKAREQQRRYELQARQAQQEAARQQRMTKRQLKDKIYRHANKLGQKLTQPSDKNHIPDGFRGAVAGLLESLDLESEFGYLDLEKQQRAENKIITITETDPDGTTTTRKGRPEDLYPTKRTEKARALMAEVEKLQRGESQDVEEKSQQNITIDPDLVDKLERVAQFGDKRMSELDEEELRTVWEAIVTLEHSIRDADRMLGRSKYAKVSDMGYQIIQASRVDNSRADKKRQEKLNYVNPIGLFDNLFQLDQLTPETYFHRLGPAGDDMYNQMRRAQDRQVEILDEGVNHYKLAMKQAGVTEDMVREWEKDSHKFEFDTVKGKQSINLTTGEMMELYLLTKRQQALDHLYKGGITNSAAEETVKKAGVPVKVKGTKADAVMLGVEGVQQVVSQLTDQQKEFANNLQAYLSGALAAHGNEASLAVYGYSKFGEKNYWPITTEETTNKKDFGKGARDVGNFANMIPSYGMAKALTPNANNAVNLHNITDTYTRHLNQMATYSAWLATNENLVKVFNYKQWGTSQDGKYLDGTTRTAIKNMMGEKAPLYYQNLVYDISMGTKAGGETGLTESGFNAFKAAAVGANIRVILQQPTSILRAAEILPAKYLLQVNSPFKAFERAKEHSGIARWKDWGYFEMDTGRNLRELMLGEDTRLDRIKNGMMAGAGLADNFAWGILWNGVEAETRDLYPQIQEGSQEFWERCNQRFGEIIDRTQVVDSVLHRSDMMRSRNGLNRLATSFMSEPTKVYNMVLRSLYDIGEARRTGDATQVSKATGHLGRAATWLVISFAVNAIARAIPDFLRSDDRDKDMQTFLSEVWENFRGDFALWDYVPYLRDMASVIQGLSVERTDLQGLSDLTQAVKQLGQSINGTGKQSVFSSGLNMARKAASAFGIPVDNLIRDVTSISNTLLWATNQNEIVYNLDKLMLPQSNSKNDSVYYDTLYRAMRDNADQYLHIYTDMLANGYDADAIQKAMEQRMWKEAQLKWKDEDEVTSKGSSLLPVDWEAPGENEDWDEFLEKARDQDNWADTLADDQWGMVQELEKLPTGSSKAETAQKRRMIADQPYSEDIKEDAMEAILSNTAFNRYMAARNAGLTTSAYVDLLEDMEAEAVRMASQDPEATGNITKEIVEKVLQESNLSTSQKKAIWSSYYKSKSPWG